MKWLKFILLFVVAIVLSGCQSQKPQVFEENAYLYLQECLDINLPNNINLSKVTWENSNPEVAYFESTYRIVGFDTGTTTITATDGIIQYILNIEVLDEMKLEREINDIIAIIRKQVKIENDELILVNELEGYDFKISYVSTKPEVLSLDGVFTRGLIDKHVNLIGTIIYKGKVKEFPIPVRIDMIPYDEQQLVIKNYINENVKDIVASESGKLPTFLDLYNLDIDWRSDKPGIIDSNKNLFKAYEATQVKLYAVYKIAGKEESMEIKYLSKGISEEEKASYINRVLQDLIPSEAGRWLNTIYSGDISIIQDFIYPDAVTQLRPGTGKNGVKMSGGPQYVVIHDSGMTNDGDNAKGLNTFIHGNANSPTGRVASWHFSVDQEQIYQHVPTDEIAWHAGDGSSKFGSTYYNSTYKADCIGGGNQNGIGIETCINPGNDYELTLKRTAKLTASLLHQYNLGLDRIKQHNDFSGKNCPNVIRSTAGMWENFLRDVEIQYFLMMIDKNYHASWEISHHNIIKESGLIIKPIDDTDVTLVLSLTLNGKIKTYEYKTTVKGLPIDVKLSNVFYDLYLYKIPRVVTNDITLPTENKDYKAQITWSSNNPDFLNNEGKYTKPSTSENVVLTVTINIDGVELIRTINVTVE